MGAGPIIIKRAPTSVRGQKGDLTTEEEVEVMDWKKTQPPVAGFGDGEKEPGMWVASGS